LLLVITRVVIIRLKAKSSKELNTIYDLEPCFGASKRLVRSPLSRRALGIARHSELQEVR